MSLLDQYVDVSLMVEDENFFRKIIGASTDPGVLEDLVCSPAADNEKFVHSLMQVLLSHHVMHKLATAQALPDCTPQTHEHISHSVRDPDTLRCECSAGPGGCESLVFETDTLVICTLMFVAAQLGAWANSMASHDS